MSRESTAKKPPTGSERGVEALTPAAKAVYARPEVPQISKLRGRLPPPVRENRATIAQEPFVREAEAARASGLGRSREAAEVEGEESGLESMSEAQSIFEVAEKDKIPLAVFLTSKAELGATLSALEGGAADVPLDGVGLYMTKFLAVHINSPKKLPRSSPLAPSPAVFFGKAGGEVVASLVVDEAHRELRLAARVGLILALRGGAEAAILAKSPTYKISAAYFTETSELTGDLPDGTILELRGWQTADGSYDGITISVAPA